MFETDSIELRDLDLIAADDLARVLEHGVNLAVGSTGKQNHGDDDHRNRHRGDCDHPPTTVEFLTPANASSSRKEPGNPSADFDPNLARGSIHCQFRTDRSVGSEGRPSHGLYLPAL
jgi:hypothetical protein